jgi:hypothetical protein
MKSYESRGFWEFNFLLNTKSFKEENYKYNTQNKYSRQRILIQTNTKPIQQYLQKKNNTLK